MDRTALRIHGGNAGRGQNDHPLCRMPGNMPEKSRFTGTGLPGQKDGDGSFLYILFGQFEEMIYFHKCESRSSAVSL